MKMVLLWRHNIFTACNCIVTLHNMIISLYQSFLQVLHVKFQGIILQLADGVQGFTPHQLAKGTI